jgi:phytanoyl-CoA hydroxylase
MPERPSPQQLAHFRENGYLVLRGAVPRDEHRELHRAVRRILDGRDHGIRSRKTLERDGQASTQLQQLHRASPVVEAFLARSVLAATAAALMATDEVRLWHDQLIHKPAGNGGRVDWHQDYYYWQHLDRPGSVSSWTALTESNRENGCVWVVPGSHRSGLVPEHEESGFPFRTDGGEPRLDLPGRRCPRPVALELEPGDVSFHHCLTLHGSGPNATPHPRYGYVTHFLPGGVRYRRDRDRLREHEVTVADGEPIAGSGFPLLHRREH